jgi:hypothetical protein
VVVVFDLELYIVIAVAPEDLAVSLDALALKAPSDFWSGMVGGVEMLTNGLVVVSSMADAGVRCRQES